MGTLVDREAGNLDGRRRTSARARRHHRDGTVRYIGLWPEMRQSTADPALAHSDLLADSRVPKVRYHGAQSSDPQSFPRAPPVCEHAARRLLSRKPIKPAISLIISDSINMPRDRTDRRTDGRNLLKTMGRASLLRGRCTAEGRRLVP
ncbi:uncharacterized protein LOC114254674 [Monomorium pharaonis]|uniref:uncharacterized protein LOC114254674 n=1 Tax=Monomorium pharaonis TaxID=307658 RepID=UPI0017461014|nr:uncharacterized protein LOC114254674 [Monomorium pharaonis]